VTLRHGFLCFFAVVTIVLLAVENYETWTDPLWGVTQTATLRKSRIKADVSRPPRDQKGLQEDLQANSSIASYTIISEKNPFHPGRKEFPVITAGPPPEVKKPVVRPQVSLFGVTIVGDYKSACISYPGRPLQKGEREVVTVKIGDRVGEYEVTKISEDRIGLKAQEDNFEVLLYDNRAPKKRVIVKTQNKPTTTTSTVPGTPGAAPAAARPVPVPGTPSREGIAEAPKPIPLPPAAAGSSDRAKRERVRQQKEQMFQRTPPAGE
jgi:hypothetical protein